MNSNVSSGINEFSLIKRKNHDQLQLQQKLQMQQINNSNVNGNQKKDASSASNQLKQFQYQQHLINQQHLRQIKLQQQQQQKHHLIYQQQQQQTQLNILNHNQNVTASLNQASAIVNPSKVSLSNTASHGNSASAASSSSSPPNDGQVLVQIESEIQKTYNFYVQMLKERKEYLIKELNTIISYALQNNQANINKQLKLQYQLEMKKQQLEKETEQELNELKMLTSQQTTSPSSNANNTNGKLEVVEDLLVTFK